METVFFSFGHGQVCPITGKNLIDHHVRIDAKSWELARAVMVQMFGTNWSFDYPSYEAMTGNGQHPSTEYVRIEFGGDPS